MFFVLSRILPERTRRDVIDTTHAAQNSPKQNTCSAAPTAEGIFVWVFFILYWKSWDFFWSTFGGATQWRRPTTTFPSKKIPEKSRESAKNSPELPSRHFCRGNPRFADRFVVKTVLELSQTTSRLCCVMLLLAVVMVVIVFLKDRCRGPESPWIWSRALTYPTRRANRARP